MSNEQGYKRAIEKVLGDSRINKANLEILKKYDTQGILQQVTIGTRVVRLNIIRQLAVFLNKNFKDMTKEDIEIFYSTLGELAA